MSEVDKLRQAIGGQKEVNQGFHFQSKDRISNLEKKYSSLGNRITELQGAKADVEELKERIDNLERGLKNLWSAFKDIQDRKAS